MHPIPEVVPTPAAAGVDEWDYYRAAVGARGAEYYLSRFRRFQREGAWRPDWNWAAFLFGNLWVLHRKQEALFGIYLVVAAALLIAGGSLGGWPGAALAWGIPGFAVFPIYANGLYYLYVRRRVRNVSRTTLGHEARIAWLENRGLAAGKRRGARWGACAAVGGGIWLLASVSCGCGGANYAVRAKCSEAMLASSALKMQVTEFAIANERLPRSSAELEGPPAAVESKYVRSFELRPDATIVLRLHGTKEFEGRSIILRPSLEGTQVTWVCGTPDPAFYRYLPTSCRNELT